MAWWYLIGGVFLYLVQFLESISTTTYNYLTDIESLGTIGTRINQLKMTRPKIYFRIQCYHYETRYRTVERTDDQGNSYSTQESYQERINTWYATEPFYFNQWTDTSADPSSIGYISELHLTRLKFYKVFSYSTYSHYSFKQ